MWETDCIRLPPWRIAQEVSCPVTEMGLPDGYYRSEQLDTFGLEMGGLDDIKLQLAIRADRWSATFYGNNLLNDDGATLLSEVGDNQRQILRPRTLGLELTFEMQHHSAVLPRGFGRILPGPRPGFLLRLEYLMNAWTAGTATVANLILRSALWPPCSPSSSRARCPSSYVDQYCDRISCPNAQQSALLFVPQALAIDPVFRPTA